MKNLGSMKSARLLTMVLLAACLAATASAEPPVRPTAFDIAAMSRVSGLSLSPNGDRLAYVRTKRTFDKEAKASSDDKDAGWTIEAQLWVVDTSGGEPVQLTFREERASRPRFSPDGKHLAFMRKVGEESKIHVIDLAGGEARVVGTGDLKPSHVEWSPDGNSLAFLAEQPETDEEKDLKWSTGGAVCWESRWRNNYLWVVPSNGGEPRRVTGDEMNIVDFVWSPDGSRFLAATAVSSDPYFAYSLVTPRVLSAEDGSLVKTLEEQPAAVGHLAWSPDGQRVAYETGVETLSLLNTLKVHEVEGEGVWNAAQGLDPTLRGFFFDADSRSLIVHVIEGTGSRLYRLASDGSERRDLGHPARVLNGGLIPSRDRGLFVCVSSTTSSPPDPTVLTLPDLDVRVAASINPQVENWQIGQQEVVSWSSPEGMTIEGVLFRTPLADPGAKAPLMVLPHGGPDSVTTRSFSSWAHFFAARGLSVLRPNYRGGLGYGYEAYAANRGRLGEIEFMDIEAGVDKLIADGTADPERLFYGGWSWGGYLTAWTIGHSDRYRAAVAGAAVVDTVNQYVTSDINHGVAAEWEYTTMPWGNFGPFDKANPMRSLHRAKTPTLIIHGQSDDRVPFSQGLTLYRALSDSGAEVKMLAYPREPHGFREPAHTRHMLEAWAAWYEMHGLVD